MLKIFVSYRRSDTTAIVGRIRERLCKHFSVEVDTHTIPPGSVFKNYIVQKIEQADVMLVVIGERWTCGTGSSAVNRLDDPEDFVRIEVEAALQRPETTVIPVLVGKVTMPSRQNLPPSLQPVTKRQAVRIDEAADFDHHITRLTNELKKIAQNLEAARQAESTPAPSSGERPDAMGVVASIQPAVQIPMKPGPIPLTARQGVALTAFLLILNSILAPLGSFLWNEMPPYWAAFMVYGLACAHFRYWGLLLAGLSAVMSGLLGIDDVPYYFYIPTNLFQAVLVMSAFRLLGIDPGLARFRDKVSYLVGGVIVPSACGAGLGWWLHVWTKHGAPVGPFLPYMGWWVLENLLPALLPGIWLHRVVDSLRRPFAWTRDGRKTNWVSRTLEYTAPWTLTLFLTGSFALFLVFSELHQADASHNFSPPPPAEGGISGETAAHKGSRESLSSVREFAGHNPIFRWLVFSMCISILTSIGFSVRHGRQAWQLEQAIRRHLPSPEEADLILSGKACPSERKVVSLLVVRLINYSDAMRVLRPLDLIEWLNKYFDALMAAAATWGGHVDHLATGETPVVFGLRKEAGHANSALLCAVEIGRTIQERNKELVGKRQLEFRIAIGAHAGPIVAGEVGSRDRRHYTVIGSSLDLALKIALLAGDDRDLSQSGLISIACMREAGLLIHSLQDLGLIESPHFIEEDGNTFQLCAIANTARFEQSLLLASQSSV